MFCKLRTVPHYGLCCVYNGGSGVFRAGAKILALVQGTERSTVQDVGMGNVICTKVVDPADTQFYHHGADICFRDAASGLQVGSQFWCGLCDGSR